MLRDLLRKPDDFAPALSLLASARPDVVLLTDFDFDHDLAALSALQAALAAAGLDLGHAFARRPNSGMPTGLDLDGDGRLGGPRDAQGFGYFAGQGGQAVLSRYPVSLRWDASEALWRDAWDTAQTPDDTAVAVQRLSTSAHWMLDLDTPAGRLALLTLAATPPVFDGPEDRNGRRNRDEVLFWAHVLDNRLSVPPPEDPVVVLGNFNLDPDRGDGLHEAAATLVGHPRLQDPLLGATTVVWEQTGPMRVSYVLPDAALSVTAAGVTPPAEGRGPHGLVWVDLLLASIPTRQQPLAPPLPADRSD